MEQKISLRSRFFRRGDLFLAGTVLALALLLLLGAQLLRQPGCTAVVITPDGEFTLPLDIPTVRTVEGRNHISLTLEVAGGQIRVKTSGCPDQICVGTGWLSSAGQTAACVPAGIAIRISAEQPEADMIAG